MTPEFIAGMEAGLEAAARRYDAQRESILKTAAGEKDKHEQDRYARWAQDNAAHAHGLRNMVKQFAEHPEGELAAAVPNGAAAYFDDSFPVRACDYCGRDYRGPAVYCCLAHALADA